MTTYTLLAHSAYAVKIHALCKNKCNTRNDSDVILCETV